VTIARNAPLHEAGWREEITISEKWQDIFIFRNNASHPNPPPLLANSKFHQARATGGVRWQAVITAGGRLMLKRLWRGWTSAANADAYEELLRSTIFPGIEARAIEGFLSIALLRRPVGAEVEFMTIMSFADLEAVRRFAGLAHDTAVVPPAAQALLDRYDAQSAHYDVRIPC
jgi:hypothetical protein